MQSKFIKEDFVINWKSAFFGAFKRWWVILIAFIVGAIGGYCSGLFILTPTYKCNVVYLLSFNTNGSGVNDMYSQWNLATKVIQSCQEVAELNGLSTYLEEHDANIVYGADGITIEKQYQKGEEGYMSAGYILSKMTFSRSANNGMLVTASVATEDKEECQRIVTALYNNFEDFMHTVFPNKTQGDSGQYLTTFTVVNVPIIPNRPTARYPKKVLTAIGAVVLSVMTYIVLVFNQNLFSFLKCLFYAFIVTCTKSCVVTTLIKKVFRFIFGKSGLCHQK